MSRFLFKLCSQFLLCLGRDFHISYQQISVVFNLYLQGSVLILSGVLPFIASCCVLVEHSSSFRWALSVAMLIYASLYGALGYLLFKHYPPKWDDSFNLCVVDLLKICDVLCVSYVVLNLIIFVVWWLTLIFVNLLLSYYILH